PIEKLLSVLSEITQIDIEELATWVFDVQAELIDKLESLLLDEQLVDLEYETDEDEVRIISHARKLEFAKHLGELYRQHGTPSLIETLPFNKITVDDLLRQHIPLGDGSITVRTFLQNMGPGEDVRAASMIHLL